MSYTIKKAREGVTLTITRAGAVRTLHMASEAYAMHYLTLVNR